MGWAGAAWTAGGQQAQAAGSGGRASPREETPLTAASLSLGSPAPAASGALAPSVL